MSSSPSMARYGNAPNPHRFKSQSCSSIPRSRARPIFQVCKSRSASCCHWKSLRTAAAASGCHTSIVCARSTCRSRRSVSEIRSASTPTYKAASFMRRDSVRPSPFWIMAASREPSFTCRYIRAPTPLSCTLPDASRLSSRLNRSGRRSGVTARTASIRSSSSSRATNRRPSPSRQRASHCSTSVRRAIVEEDNTHPPQTTTNTFACMREIRYVRVERRWILALSLQSKSKYLYPPHATIHSTLHSTLSRHCHHALELTHQAPCRHGSRRRRRSTSSTHRRLISSLLRLKEPV